MYRRTSRVLALTLTSLAAIALLAAAVPASAQGTAVYYYKGTQWELTPFCGYYIAQDLYSVASGAYQGSTIGLKNSFMYGGRLGVYPKPYGGLEFQYARTGSDVDVKTRVNNFQPTDLGSIAIDNFDFNFVARQHNLSNPRVTGFGTIGLGWAVTHPDIRTAPGTGYDGNSLFSINFGLGANVEMSQKVALRLEGRWKITDTNVTTGSYTYCDYWGYCYGYSSSSYSSGELTAGLSYKLGRQ